MQWPQRVDANRQPQQDRGDKPKVQSLFERLINGEPLPPETGLADLTRTQ